MSCRADPCLFEGLLPERLHRVASERIDTIDAFGGRNLQQAQVGEERFLADEFRIDPEVGMRAEFGRNRIGFVDEREGGH